MNTESKTLLAFTKVNEGESNEHEEMPHLSEETYRHVKNKHVVIVDSQEVERLIEALENDDCLYVHRKQIITFKLCQHLVKVHISEQNKLTEIIHVEWISEVFPVLLFQLNPFERNEEQLNKQANGV